ncbi:hypothetical protein [Streptomyces yunnanensis]|uniref:hypothetical protein n=1 Tax=Streptomyces yunnanensis TaxID=156453 RepID=UPI001161496D|nr:hypothetical protein [Streptomyces yunnanensis]
MILQRYGDLDTDDFGVVSHGFRSITGKEPQGDRRRIRGDGSAETQIFRIRIDSLEAFPDGEPVCESLYINGILEVPQLVREPIRKSQLLPRRNTVQPFLEHADSHRHNAFLPNI